MTSVPWVWSWHTIQLYNSLSVKKWTGVICVTVQVVVFIAVWVGERVELPEQQWLLQDPLDGFDQVRLQSGGMLLSGVPLGQESLEIWVGFRWVSRNMIACSFCSEGKGTQTDTGRRLEKTPSHKEVATKVSVRAATKAVNAELNCPFKCFQGSYTCWPIDFQDFPWLFTKFPWPNWNLGKNMNNLENVVYRERTPAYFLSVFL